MTLTREALEDIAEKERARQDAVRHHILVCAAAGCASCHSEDIVTALAAAVVAQGLESSCEVRPVGCIGLCAEGPLVAIAPQGIIYRAVKPQDAADIVAALDTRPLERCRLPAGQPFFSSQTRVVLENCGRIDPTRIEGYIAVGGYRALYTALRDMTPESVLAEMTRSGLRGRGGAGFPTGLKWVTVAKSVGASKSVVCNADEGDPGAFMDRSVLESDPHRVLEGMAIAGYAVGASQGYVYVRAEYPLAVKHLRMAITQAERLGVIGRDIFHSPFEFTVKIRLGAGAFVCGEETALMASIEGRPGKPRPRPPYPAESGLWGAPTLINNVETFANVPAIIRNGGAWFAAMGTERSKGTKVFALAGRVRNTGLIEVPMGISLRRIVDHIGGGIVGGRPIKAVLTGGPSGGCIPENLLDMPVDYESLTQVGSIMGSGGMIVLDDTACMVDVAKYFMDFCRTESCGQCVPCRVGTVHIHGLLEKICRGDGTLEDVAMLEDLCDLVKQTSLCGLGQTASNPVLSTLRHFREEYLAHIQEKTCPAGVCQLHVGKEGA
ncbi:MAG: NADH-quinone oxidoreductase subunit NuoF [Pseudomonadota bacterium]